uniref:Uncharacterized protein n=1 Tax=Trichuris muris TaxID=70415 RepID=A0A5S6QU13_TRIMR
MDASLQLEINIQLRYAPRMDVRKVIAELQTALSVRDATDDRDARNLLRHQFDSAVKRCRRISNVSVALNMLDLFASLSSSCATKSIVVRTLDDDVANVLLTGLSMSIQKMDESLFEQMGVADLPTIAHVVHILLSWAKVYKDSKVVHLAFCLQKLLCCSPTTLSSVFPGTYQAIIGVLLQSDEQTQSNLADYICLLFEMLKLVVRFEKNKSEQWRCTAARMLESSMLDLTNRYARSAICRIRQSLGVQSASLLVNCPDVMLACQGRLLDVVATLVYDADPNVAEEVRLAANDIFRNKFQSQMVFKLLECCDRLPLLSQNVFSSQQQMEYQLLCGYVALLGQNGMRKFSLCESHVETLVNSMLECIAVKLSPVIEYTVEEEFASKETCSSLPADSCVVLVIPEEPRAQELLKETIHMIGSFSDLQLLTEALLQKTMNGRLKMEALYALNQSFLGALKCSNGAASDFAEITLQVALEEFSNPCKIPLIRILLLLEAMRCCSLTLKSNLLPYLLSGLYVALSLAGEHATKAPAERVLASFAVALVSSLLIRLRYHSLYPEIKLPP